MLTAVNRQVQAFGDSALAAESQTGFASVSTVECDVREIQDLIHIGVSVAQVVSDHVDELLEATDVPAEHWQHGVRALSAFLQALGRVRKMTSRLAANGHRFRSLLEFEAALVKTRQCLSVAQDHELPSATQAAHAEVLARASCESVASQGERGRPPQSWFEEDVTGVRG